MTLQNRFQSLDVFRGMDVALMIIVNSLGSYDTAWSPLLHADWHGFTLTDLVFPTFLFVVGNAMCFSLARYESLGAAAVMGKIFRRTATIFLIGFLMYWFPFCDITSDGLVFRPISGTRIFGVLQRIALCYGIAALVIHFWKERGALIFSIFALVTYTLILLLFGDLTMLGNAGTQLDLWLLGENHMYKGEGVAFEPEGLLSTLPSVVNVLAGYLAASLIRSKGASFETIARLMITGAILLAASQWADLLHPINKKLWTSSYVLHTVGLDLLILPVVMFLVDLSGIRKWTGFFEVFGKNTLFIYLLSEVLVITLYWAPAGDASLYEWIFRNVFLNFFNLLADVLLTLLSWTAGENSPWYQWIYQNVLKDFSAYISSFLFGVWIMLTCWVAGWALDKKGIYIKV